MQQLEVTDCGAACLAMTLALHGKRVPLDELRETTRTGREGVDAQAIAEAARAQGLEARGVRLELDGLPDLDRGSILHWEFNHFVVFDGLARDGVDIVDPAVGRRRVPMDRFRKSFTGIALTFRPSVSFTRTGRHSSGVWRYLRPVLGKRGLLSRIGTLSVLVQVLALGVPILTGVVVDRVVPAGDAGLLGAVTAGLLVMVAFHFLASFARAHMLLRLRTHLDLDLTMGFVAHLVRLPYAFFLRRSAGDIMMRLNSNTTVREILTSTTLSTLLDGTLVSLYLVLILAQSPRMGLIVLGLAAIQVGVLLVTHERNRRLMSESLQAQSRTQSYLVQLIAAIDTLKAAGAERRALEHWSNLFVDEINVALARGSLSAFVDSAMNALRVGSPLVILAFGATQVVNGQLTLGTMLALVALAGGFLAPLSTLISTGGQVQLLGSYMERINDVLDMSPEQDPSQVRGASALEGRIAFRDVSFRYSPRAPLALEEISVEIEPGQTIAVVGRSGSGKSTFAHVLLGLFLPDEGQVLYDGTDLQKLDTASVRRQIGMVLQKTYLFGASIRENIALSAPDATQVEVEKAARMACVHEDITAMGMGYDTILADGGATLSGGQRQRIALARALVHEPKILVLDEATSALDSLTEKNIYQNLRSHPATRVIIAHRLSTIAHADRILYMEGGRFVEQGTHQSLLRDGGRYAELVRAQETG